MRKLKQVSLAVAIMLAISAGATAGIIECPPEPPPATGITDTPPPSDQQSGLIAVVTITLVQIAISGR